ncbi:hypothetical protein ZWY2020_044727 [Hordeum vulgare]|nr:hypothetical protein ZWY2020_044727 [Hordeum vulgare]
MSNRGQLLPSSISMTGGSRLGKVSLSFDHCCSILLFLIDIVEYHQLQSDIKIKFIFLLMYEHCIVIYILLCNVVALGHFFIIGSARR